VLVVPFLQEALDVVTADLYFLYLELGVFALTLACQHLTVNVFYFLGFKIDRNVLLTRVVDVVDHVCLLLQGYFLQLCVSDDWLKPGEQCLPNRFVVVILTKNKGGY
jgi:hypothetical protein